MKDMKDDFTPKERLTETEIEKLEKERNGND